MILPFIKYIKPVEIGGFGHLMPIVVAIMFAVSIIRLAKYRSNTEKQNKIFHTIGVFVSLTVFVYHLYLVFQGGYDMSTDLPLYLCSFMAIFIFIFTYYRKYWMYEILLFWVLAGTSQAIITPDIDPGYPSFEFFRYWIVHLGLVIIVLYATFVFNMRPTLKSLLKSFLAIQVFFVFSLIINYALDANYSYLNRKPNAATVLDYLGDWPTYIFVVEALLIPYFLIIYLPFYISKRRNKTT